MSNEWTSQPLTPGDLKAIGQGEHIGLIYRVTVDHLPAGPPDSPIPNPLMIVTLYTHPRKGEKEPVTFKFLCGLDAADELAKHLQNESTKGRHP